MKLSFWSLVALSIGFAVAGCASQKPAPIETKTSALAGAARPARPPLVRAPGRPTVVPDRYRVVRGDTLYSIAFRYGLDPRAIAQWNALNDPNRIFVGQELRLKPSSGAPSVPAPRAVAPVAGAAPPSVPPAAAPPTAPRPAPPQPATATAPTPNAVPGATRTVGGLVWTWPASGKTRRAVAPSGSEGLEIIGQRGQPVLAAADGQVVYSGNGLRGYGQLIIVKHDETFLSAYAHNDKLLVAEGARVKVGQQIAEMGDSEASEVMLHFEIRKSGKAVGPLQFLPQR